MKKTTLPAAAILVLGLLALAMLRGAGLRASNEYVRVGISVPELQKALSKVQGLMPPHDARLILDVTVMGPTEILIRTGMISGPESGKGKEFKFRKNGRKWEKVSEDEWVS